MNAQYITTSEANDILISYLMAKNKKTVKPALKKATRPVVKKTDKKLLAIKGLI